MIAYNLDSLWRRLVLPARIGSLVAAEQLAAAAGQTGGRLRKHGRYYWLLLAASHLTR